MMFCSRLARIRCRTGSRICVSGRWCCSSFMEGKDPLPVDKNLPLRRIVESARVMTEQCGFCQRKPDSYNLRIRPL